jgi:hypothetical protein
MGKKENKTLLPQAGGLVQSVGLDEVSAWVGSTKLAGCIVYLGCTRCIIYIYIYIYIHTVALFYTLGVEWDSTPMDPTYTQPVQPNQLLPQPDPTSPSLTHLIPADLHPFSSPTGLLLVRTRGASGAAVPRGPSASRRVEERRGAGPSARVEAREQQRVGFARAAARGERDLFWGSRIPQVLPSAIH